MDRHDTPVRCRRIERGYRSPPQEDYWRLEWPFRCNPRAPNASKMASRVEAPMLNPHLIVSLMAIYAAIGLAFGIAFCPGGCRAG
jgi:hypothetical protein